MTWMVGGEQSEESPRWQGEHLLGRGQGGKNHLGLGKGRRRVITGESVKPPIWVAAAVTAWVYVAVVLAGPAVAQSGGFGDVVEDAYYSVPVTALSEMGVFAGTECAQGFCPNDPIDRKTMAVWMVRVLDGEDPPVVSASMFDDVHSGSFHAPFIERLAQLGVTEGCGDGSGFCPDRVVSRAQMAVFLTRAFGLPSGADPGFVDVAVDAWYVAAVSSLAASGITGGCGNGTGFCPGRDTSRAHMATFIHRALNPSSSDRQHVVRVLYAVPSDREFRSDYSQAIRRATEHIRWWYQQQLDGLTFSLKAPLPEKCQMSQPHDFYARYSWQRVLNGVQHCAPAADTPDLAWVVFADVVHECGPGGWEQGYDQLGRGGHGLTILTRWDLQGLTGEAGQYYYCDGDNLAGPFNERPGRWFGGIAHELGHAFGLPHPPGCDEGLPTCDEPALMQNGYQTYPDTYLRDDDKASLRASPFITPHDPLLQPPAIPCPTGVQDDGKSEIRGTLVGPDGQPLAGIGIWAWPWAWSGDSSGYAYTCHDGTFTISVPDGMFALYVYAAANGSCAGQYDGESVTDDYREAVKITVQGQDIDGITIRLPALPQDIPSGEC